MAILYSLARQPHLQTKLHNLCTMAIETSPSNRWFVVYNPATSSKLCMNGTPGPGPGETRKSEAHFCLRPRRSIDEQSETPQQFTFHVHGSTHIEVAGPGASAKRGCCTLGAEGGMYKVIRQSHSGLKARIRKASGTRYTAPNQNMEAF